MFKVTLLSMFDRILILSASVGNGHVTAAEALKKAFEERGLGGLAANQSGPP